MGDNVTELKQPSKFELLLKNIKKSKHYYVLLAPFAILFFTFTVIPVIMSLGISFSYFNLLEPPKFIGLDNYIKLFLEDDVF
ncbi:MAG: sugar ABC transporter permease, partial [Candidatus Izimaplasma sp.]|nr:sugar ABC transporter permease [Candidatus Izimaplasma bacterium]